MSEAIFRKEALAFQHERLWGEVIISQPLSFQVVTALIACAATLALLYLCTSEYTRRENVVGFLVPTKGIVAVYPPQPGLLSELYTAEGDSIEQGSDLFKMQIDQKITSGNYISHEVLEELAEQRTRLVNAVHLEEQNLASILERQEITNRKIQLELASLDTQIETQTVLGELENNSFARARELTSSGAISKADRDNVEKHYLEQRQQLSSLQANRDNKILELEEAANIRNSYQIDNQKEISALENRMSELDRQIATAEAEQTNIIRAPVAGTITTLLPSLGQKIDASLPVVTIIPEGAQLDAQLYVPTSAIGFIREGQVVNLRYEAFPYQRFGVYTGRIKQVTNSVLGPKEIPELLPIKEPVYRITVALTQQRIVAYGQDISLKPGMLLSADIELDKRSLFEWLLAPLYSLQGKL